MTESLTSKIPNSGDSDWAEARLREGCYVRTGNDILYWRDAGGIWEREVGSRTWWKIRNFWQSFGFKNFVLCDKTGKEIECK